MIRNSYTIIRLFPIILLTFLLFLLNGCASFGNPRAKLILQEKNLVAFEMAEEEIPRIFSKIDVIPKFSTCKNFSNRDLQYLFRSLRDENPSLFGRKDRPVFPTSVALENFNQKILTAIQNSERSPEFLFFVWKVDDSLDPYTRIQRTSFYLFCEKDSLSIIIGEWKRDIVFQNQYTWSEWITASRFTYDNPEKQRLFIIDSFQDRVQFNAERKAGETKVYQDWVNIYREKVPADKQVPKLTGDSKPTSEESKSKLSERLQTLEDLKKKGLIDEREYKEKRKELLDSL
ncbi:MAG: SHOCT domain-containing protein [Leptospira sp.]|nr:SHOCT domain-containing protein [Leptospira sp.]